MKSVFTLLVIAMSSNFAAAQITGKITDQNSKEALEYATAALYNKETGKLVTGVVTEQNGEFLIKGIKAGDYKLEASFMGYKTQNILDIKIPKKNAFVDLGTIELSINSSELDAVVLTGEAATVVHKIDRQVFDTDKFQNSQGGSAVDVIKNLPSVSVGAEGNINVRGSNSFAVLLNGKPTQGDAASILAQLPANALEKVELITAPSAKYDSEGAGGILNIITKKGAVNGDYLQVNVRGGLPAIQDYDTKEYPHRYGADVTYNTRTDNWNFSVGASYQRNDISGRREGGLDIINEANNTHRYLPSDGERSFDDVSYNARFTVDYTPNDADEFTLGLYGGKKKKDRLADIYYDNYTVPAVGSGAKTNEFAYYNHNLRTRKGDFALASFDYAHKFEDKSKLAASVLYEYTFLGGPTENDNVSDIDYTEVYQQEKNTNDNPLNGVRFNLDYKWKPMSFGTIETGYQFRHLDHTGDFTYERKNVTLGDTQFNPVPEFSSDIALKRTIHAAYAQISGGKEKWNYAAGVRAESMDREYKEKLASDTNKNTYKYDYFKLFPSASLQYKVNDKTNVKAAYSKRVQRTTTFKMNSFAEREHSEVYEQGDNELKPEFIDLVELGINKRFKGGNSIYATAYFRHTKNVINRVNALVYEDGNTDGDNNSVTNPNPVVNDSILNRVYSNVGKSNAVGIELGATFKPSKNWTNFIGANIYNYAIDGALSFDHRNGKGERIYDINSESTIYSFNVNSTYSFWENASIQFALNYISDRNTAMGEDSRFYTPNLTFKKSFMDDRLMATLQWQNIDMGLLKSNEQRISTWRPDEFYTTTNYVYEVDIVSLNLTYTFNKFKNKSKFIDSEFGKSEF
ncbi:outer membrane receptor protein involved in Fe transport [Wenyingzhuangia heitensis]|uniref:Outer membrane receptor protein involved in Fe transport n=1 Tax=Wenyingzhuangia heitensis TaxID=1487859 RepID=A0ABX0UCK7_9FLAO|nr:outer membrane beta-barrel family protein [Wenyingzhuangia heitensis]NIJ45620.1 outer membrane receptor protein involved in Fe transport [Wenyingzhuangia heitensis]